MRAITVSTVLVAVTDQLRRTRMKHTLEQIDSVNLIGDSVNLLALLQQCVNRQPNIVILDFNLAEEELVDVLDQIQARSKSTKIMFLDTDCKGKDIMQWAARGVLAYSTSDTDAHSLELAIASMQTNSIWISAQLTKLPERATELQMHQPPSNSTANIDCGIMANLSEREKEVLRLLVAGHKNFAIAQALAISPETIKSHMRRIMEKLAVRDRTQLVIKVLQQGAA